MRYRILLENSGNVLEEVWNLDLDEDELQAVKRLIGAAAKTFEVEDEAS